MARRRIRYTIKGAVAWAAEMRVALDEGKPLPFTVRIPGFECEQDRRPAAFAHWAEYAYRALRADPAAARWADQFDLYRNLDTLEDEFTCLLSVLKCVQREHDDTAEVMTADHLLAAEIFGYSFAHYRDRLGIGKIRFDDLMPDDARRLRRAVLENWPLAKVAKDQGVDADDAASLIQSAKAAIDVVDASTPADSFRVSIRQLVQKVSERGLDTDAEIENLVTQICYRVADLSCLLEMKNASLGDYSQVLREEPEEISDEEMDT